MIQTKNVDENLNISDPKRKETSYLKTIIENNSFYIVKTDLEGKYTYVNPFFCNQLGITGEHFLGKQSLNLIVPEDHQQFISTISQCLDDPCKSHFVMLRISTPSGIISTQWEFKSLLDENKTPMELLCIGHDITILIIEQQELQKLLNVTADLSKRLINFTYIVSHKIRSHAANITGIINVSDDINDSRLVLKMLKESSDSLNQTLNDLNEVISIQSKIKLPLEKINIYQEINRIFNSVEQQLCFSPPSIAYHFDRSCELTTNPAYFESILLNLITNARKYMSPQRPLSIEIAIEKQEHFLVLTFQDNGMGIDMDKYRNDLFGPYKTFHQDNEARVENSVKLTTPIRFKLTTCSGRN